MASMEIKQQLRLSQQLVMTPQLQQAIKLLQLSRVELIDLVRQEMTENPVLDETPEGAEGQERPAERVGTSAADGATGNGADGATQAAEFKEVEPAPESKSAERKADSIDWDRYLENHALQGPPPSFRSDSEELPSIEATLTKRPDLSEHLMWQLKLTDWSEEERTFGALVIGNLDEDGYLKDVNVIDLAAQAGLDPEDAEELLSMIQEFDPVGVASRDLRECLKLQAEHLNLDDIVIEIIDKHLAHVEKKNFAAIARDLHLDVEEIYAAAKIIASLEPRPGRSYTGDDPRYITPDVYVHKIGDKYFVVPNDDGLPKLKIANFYRSAISGDAHAREYVQSKLRSAQWLIRSIDQRRRTIIKVTECIIDKQREFFDKGVAFLRPMILRDVAEAVGMHESTISRVTTNKYVHTPQGIFELKYFFNSSIRRVADEDVASEAVKQAIKKLIAAEDNQHPMSDQKIVELLGQQGVVIARRTVAKYREMLGILSSAKRKKYF